MEADAKERYERKKAAEKVAAGLKEKGNAAFRQGNYEEALDWYDKVSFKCFHYADHVSILYIIPYKFHLKPCPIGKADTHCHICLLTRVIEV